jgi:hypothetical protein
MARPYGKLTAVNCRTRLATIGHMLGSLARNVMAAAVGSDGSRLSPRKHLMRGTAIDVIRQRLEDSRVEVRLANGPDVRIYLVAADAIDRATARVMSIHRPPRHRRESGGSYRQVGKG